MFNSQSYGWFHYTLQIPVPVRPVFYHVDMTLLISVKKDTFEVGLMLLVKVLQMISAGNYHLVYSIFKVWISNQKFGSCGKVHKLFYL